MNDLSASATAGILAEAKAASMGHPTPLQPKPPAGQGVKVAAQVEKIEAEPANPESDVEEPADATAESATTEGAEPSNTASVPDHSWVPEEYRAAYGDLPAEAQALLEKWKPLMLERDYRQKTADLSKREKRLATLEASEKELKGLVGDPADYLEFLKSKGKGSEPEAKGAAKPAVKAGDPFPKFSEYDSEDEHAEAAAAWNKRQIAAALAERDAPSQRQQALTDKSWEYRDTLGEAVTDEQFEKATSLFARAAKSKGKDPFAILESVGDVEIVLAPYVDAVKRAIAGKVPEAKPAPPAAKAASVRGQVATARTKEVPVWERENRDPTDRELIDEAKRLQAIALGGLAHAGGVG